MFGYRKHRSVSGSTYVNFGHVRTAYNISFVLMPAIVVLMPTIVVLLPTIVVLLPTIVVLMPTIVVLFVLAQAT